MAAGQGTPVMPFRSTAFRWLLASGLASSGANLMERTATAWLVLEAGGGAFGVGLTFAARMAPSLLFGLVAGTLADRLDRRRQLLVVGSASLLVMLVLGGLVRTGTPSLWGVVVIAFLVGCLQVFDIPARQALLVDAVAAEDAVQAVTLNAVAGRLFGALGALAGGALIPLLGVGTSYFVVAVLYAVSLGLVVLLRTPQAHRAVGSRHPPFGRALGDAARLIIDVPAVRLLSIAGIACEVFAFSHASAVPILARDVLDAGPQGLGLLNAASSFGGTLAVIALTLLPGRVPRQPLLTSVYLLYGLAIVGLGWTRDVPTAAAALVVTGACAAVFDALEQTLIQLAVPAEQRGRAVGIWVLGLGSAPFGHLEMGALTAGLGAPTSLLINGLLVVAGAATLYARAPAFRWPWRPQHG